MYVCYIKPKTLLSNIGLFYFLPLIFVIVLIISYRSLSLSLSLYIYIYIYIYTFIYVWFLKATFSFGLIENVTNSKSATFCSSHKFKDLVERCQRMLARHIDINGKVILFFCMDGRCYLKVWWRCQRSSSIFMFVWISIWNSCSGMKFIILFSTVVDLSSILLFSRLETNRLQKFPNPSYQPVPPIFLPTSFLHFLSIMSPYC